MRRPPLFALVFAVATTTCGAWIPTPLTIDHEAEAPTLITSPPPPPKLEYIPKPPENMPNAVWIDGQWLLERGAWQWSPGSFQVPPLGAKYAPPKIVYLANDQIGFYPGHFHPPPSPQK